MKLVLEAEGFEVDTWLHDFMRTTVVFAIWHHQPFVEGVHIRLDRSTDEEGESYVRCALRAETLGGHVSSRATGADVCEATQRAADRLEVALYRPFAVARGRVVPGLAA